MNQAPSQLTPTLTVTQLTQAIKVQLERTFPRVRLQGEVSNFRRQSSGHLYFSLKDPQAQISCVLFRGDAIRAPQGLRDGDQCIVEGELNVYPPRGNYQLIIRHVELAGTGALLLQLERLKAELKRRGWLDPGHKKALPTFPKRIALVTSPSGAAIQDMLNVLARRFHGLHLLVYPVRVQGQGATLEIATAIQELNRHGLADVLIVGRGGGSIEDLWAFNEEAVAQAIFQSGIPVVSAVGHETDYCLADLVADVRAPTPSAAAELVVAEKDLHLQALKNSHQRLQQTLQTKLTYARRHLDQVLRHPLLKSPYALLGLRMQRLDEVRNQVDQTLKHQIQKEAVKLSAYQRQLSRFDPRLRLHRLREALSGHHRNLNRAWQHRQEFRQLRLGQTVEQLQAIDPQHLLSKGYTILFSQKTGSVINSLQALMENPSVRLRLADGEAQGTLKDLEIT